ncbi:MAG: hypothetical protein AAB538_04435 [Patescibacteria group bacterium]
MPPGDKEPAQPQGGDDSTLKRLQRELYAKEEGDELIMRRKELSLLGKHLKKDSAPAAESETAFANVAAIRGARRRKMIMFGAAGGALVLLFVGAVVATMAFRASRQVKEEQIGIEVRAPGDVIAGEEMTYTVAVRNDSRTRWNSVEVVLETPEGFRARTISPEAEARAREIIWRIGNIAQGETKEVAATGRLLGEEGEVAVGQAEVTLTPENFPSGRFSRTAIATTRVAALPIDVSLDATSSAGSGERIRGVVHVRNLGERDLANAVLKVAAQPGVEFAPEDQEFSPGFDALSGEWNLEAIPTLGEVTRTIIFTVAGQPGERRTLEVEVGVREPAGEGQASGEVFVQRKLTHAVTISASELTIEQLYNDSAESQAVFPEEPIKGLMRYTNVGNVGMRNVILTVKFEGTGLDVGTLKLGGNNGAYDPVAQTITWSSATVEELRVVQPKEEGTLEFTFDILPATEFPLGGENAKNFTLVSTATIDSQDLPTPVGQEKKVISDRAVLSVGSQLQLAATAVYDDGRLSPTMKSTGPLPPKAGQTTTYTVKLRIGSALNDVGEARVIGVLPDGVAYTGKTVTTTGSVEFNDRSREVIWQIPLLEGLTGRTRPAEELNFQVSVTPGENLEGRTIPFLNKLIADGTDTFIEQLITTELKEFPTTETASPGKGQVE